MEGASSVSSFPLPLVWAFPSMCRQAGRFLGGKRGGRGRLAMGVVFRETGISHAR
jgi:hypothetical protein